MKFNVWHVLALCICLGQICSGEDDNYVAKASLNKKVEIIRENFYGASERFVDDVKDIFEKYQNNSGFVLALLASLIKVGHILKEKHTNFDLNQVKDLHSTDAYIMFGANRMGKVSALDIAIELDDMKIVQSILSKQLPPERYNGVINVLYIFKYKNATTEEIENTLNYLYGIDTVATKSSYIEKFPNLGSADCSSKFQSYSMPESEDILKSMVDIKPKVIQDFIAIRDTFPCNSDVLNCLEIFVNLLKRFKGNESKINVCKMKEIPEQWESYFEAYRNSKYYMERMLNDLQLTLSARLTEETYRDILNFERATIEDTPIVEMEKALEYLYDGVPKTECPVTDSSKLATK